MSLAAVGVSHATAPLPLRERVAFDAQRLPEALGDLRRGDRVREAAIVSTCNRTEVYFAGGEAREVASWLEGFHGMPKGALAAHVYTLPRERAVTHAFRVASGLESMVLGEPQILGQMKQAVRKAEEAGSLGLLLNRLFQRTFAVAKEVRTHTDIGSASISMAAAAVKLAERIFPSIASQRLLLVGAGEMIELAADHFMQRKPRAATVANRTLERGARLAQRIGAHAITLAELPGRLHEFDIVVTCTASTVPLIGKGMLERAIKRRKRAPMFIVDLGVPRDVEPQAASLPDVFLYSVDELSVLVRENLAVRHDAVAEAERMIARQTAHFLHWLDSRSAVPTIEALSRHFDALRAQELARARRSLAAGQSCADVLEALARGLTGKLLHGPLAALQAAGDAERASLAAALNRVYRR
jgi:glutamyl-tRNA reductase